MNGLKNNPFFELLIEQKTSLFRFVLMLCYMILLSVISRWFEKRVVYTGLPNTHSILSESCSSDHG